jgi:hypothetical protein
MQSSFYYLSTILFIVFAVSNYINTQSNIISSITNAEIKNIILHNPESSLALQVKLEIDNIDVAVIEDLKGINLEIAQAIKSRTIEIYSISSEFPVDKKYKAFEIIPGIGPKKAKELSKYLMLP